MSPWKWITAYDQEFGAFNLVLDVKEAKTQKHKETRNLSRKKEPRINLHFQQTHASEGKDRMNSAILSPQNVQIIINPQVFSFLLLLYTMSFI